MVASELFSSLAAPVFAATLFIFFLKRRSREINGGGAKNNAAANDGTAGGDSGTHTSTEVPEVATSSGKNKYAAANDGTAGGDSGAHTSTEVPEVATSSGANKDAAANDGTAGGDSGTHTPTEVPEMPPSSGANKDAAANDGTAGGDSGTHTSTEGQGMATSSGYDYEVFLSFKGKDTRAGFTDFLYTNLDNAGIRTFKDDKKLRVGEEFAPKLLQAINQSKISIPIFSKRYASSVWCLKELVQMVECQKTGRQKIIPIFYDVAPAEVRHQTGVYGEALHLHESKKRCDQKTIEESKDALRAVGEINGHDLQSMPNRREGEFAKKLTEEVFRELKKAYLVVSDCLVSVDNHVNAIMEMIGAETSETRIIGIHGMGGIGKTTIAKIIYNQLSKNFEGCCFLSDIRETSKGKGIPCLQHQLISDILKITRTDIRNIDEGIKTIKHRLPNKRVILLLDDVEEKDHMNALVGNRDWFGKGSKIIITTRNKEVLKLTKVDDLYEVNVMDFTQSLQLFSKHAFRRDSPSDEYIDQSHRAICIAGGLPLALEVIGSLLSGKNKKDWEDTLKMLESVPDGKVQSKLKISYDALNDRQKHIFLDIACIFIGYDKDIVVHYWDESKFPKVALEVLQNMSLIKIVEYNKVWMHDQLRDLGRELVRQESKMKIEKQRRVWDSKDALDLLRRHKGKTKVEALRLRLDRERRYYFTCEDFKRMSNLRFLQVDDLEEYFRAEERLLWHESPSNVLPTNVFRENSDLLPRLRWLSWHGIPPTFKIVNFSMEDVVILDPSRSMITHDWQGWSHMEVMKNLKILNLTECVWLERTPIFPAEVNLERLILQHCEPLTEIDRSICHLKSLVSLDLRGCIKIQRLPDELGRDLASLEYLSLAGCESLERLPDTIGNLESLIELDISGTGIKELPDSIGKLKNLKVAKLQLSNMSKIPDAFWTIEKLEEIEVQFTIASNVEVQIGNCIEKPEEIVVQFTIPFNVEVEIGNRIYRNRSLRILKLEGAAIYVVPRLPESLIILKLYILDMDTFPDVSNLTNLEELVLGFGPCDDAGESDGPVEEYPMPRWIGNLSKLKTLELHSCFFVTHLPTDISSLLPRLEELRLDCPNLRCLPRRLPSSLLFLCLYSEPMIPLPTDISSLLPRLKWLTLGCPNPRCLPSLPSSLLALELRSEHMTPLPTDISSLLPQLRTLRLRCPNLRCLPSHPSLLYLDLASERMTALPTDFSSLVPRLESLRLECPNLRCLPTLPSSLSSLYLVHCKSFGSLGDLSYLKNLFGLMINDSVISEIRGLDGSENLDLQLSELQQVWILPDLSNLNQLRRLDVSNCSNLVEIQGELPQSLEELSIFGCGSLQKLPDLSSLKGLRSIEQRRCGELSWKAVRFVGDRDESEV